MEAKAHLRAIRSEEAADSYRWLTSCRAGPSPPRRRLASLAQPPPWGAWIGPAPQLGKPAAAVGVLCLLTEKREAKPALEAKRVANDSDSEALCLLGDGKRVTPLALKTKNKKYEARRIGCWQE